MRRTPLALILGLTLLAACTDRAAEGVALVGATVIDGSGGRPFEDAVVLAESLRAHHTVVEGLDAFAARRLSRVRRVRDQTHRRDRIRSMPALVRDASLRLFGDRIYRANYSFLLGQP